MRLSSCLLMLAICCLFSPSAHSKIAPKEVAIIQSGKTIVRTLSDKKKIDIVIDTIEIEKTNSAFPYSAFTCKLKDWEIKAVTVIQQLHISVNSINLFIPRSVFADLINPLKAYVRFEKGLFVLTVSGGDAADSYFIRVYFDATRVIRRKYYSALEPNALTQETRYFQTVLNDSP